MSEFPDNPTYMQTQQMEQQRQHELRIAKLNAAATVANGYFLSQSAFKDLSAEVVNTALRFLKKELS